MPDLDYLRIAKWVLIVLLAGFIGQFGKSLAKHLMEKSRLKREGSSPTSEEAPPIITGGHEDALRMEEPPPTTISSEELAKQDKKLSKTLVKQKKKEAKVLKKQSDL